MKLTFTEELTINQKRKYANYWRYRSQWYWFWRLFQEVLELAVALLGIHKDSPRHEREQIATICMNWSENDLKGHWKKKS